MKNDTLIELRKELNDMPEKYIEVGNIAIPYGPSKNKNKRSFVFKLAGGIEVENGYEALLRMVKVYLERGIEIGAEVPSESNFVASRIKLGLPY